MWYSWPVEPSYHNEGKEKLRFAIGQNYYFEESQVTLDDDVDDDEEVSRSSMIGEFDVNFENDYFLHAGIEWNSNDKIIKRANTTVEKRWFNNTYVQASYRYYKESDEAGWETG